MNAAGRSLELYFVDGDPEGMLTAEVFNWTGHVLRIPRANLAEGLSRAEAAQTGLYLLIGTDDAGPLAYIGETENMRRRFQDHERNKEWWDQAVLITTKGDALHKAHVRYLERRLVDRALAAGTRLDNGNTPGGASLSEAAIANMESFAATLDMVLPAIRVDLFTSSRRDTAPEQAQNTPVRAPEFILTLPRHGIEATAYLEQSKLVVRAGSQARPEWVGSRSYETHSAKKLYDKLVSEKVIVSQGDTAFFTSSYAFASPSTAAAVVTGRSANGRTAWKTPDGRSYAEWEADRLKETDTE